MKSWEHILDLSGSYYTKEWNDSNVSELGKIVAKKLVVLISHHFKDDYTIEEISENFNRICTEEDADIINSDNLEFYSWDIIPIEEFDECMRGLYDWADSNRVWVKTS